MNTNNDTDRTTDIHQISPEALQLLLRPGGRMLLSSLDKHEHRSAVEAYGHANLGFTEKELRRFADRAGLRVTSAASITREKRPPHFEVVSLIGEKA